MSETMIRIVSPEDAKELLDIYAPYVKDTAVTFEYSVPSLEEFTERIRHTLDRSIRGRPMPGRQRRLFM